jgi:hypothetical protein
MWSKAVQQGMTLPGQTKSNYQNPVATEMTTSPNALIAEQRDARRQKRTRNQIARMAANAGIIDVNLVQFLNQFN